MIEEYKAILWISSGLLFWLIGCVITKVHGGTIIDNQVAGQALIICILLGPILFVMLPIVLLIDKMKGNK